MKRLAGKVVPVAASFIVDQQDQTIVQTTGREVIKIAFYDRRQTDAAVADSSETDQIWLPGQSSLGYMMVGQFAHDQRPAFPFAFDHQNFGCVRQGAKLQRFPAVGHPIAQKQVRAAQVGATGIEKIILHHIHPSSIPVSINRPHDGQKEISDTKVVTSTNINSNKVVASKQAVTQYQPTIPKGKKG